MIVWPITFTDYNGEEVTEKFYFNLNKAELVEMQFDAGGGYTAFINRITNERDVKRLGEEFKKIILNSYGKKTDDGRVFRKTQEARDDFEQSEAFAELYIELLGDADKAAKFFRGILPKDVQASAEAATPRLAE